MQGKKLSEVAEYIIANYPSSKYKMPSIEYWKYVLENPDQAPPQLKDGKYHFFFGSVFRDCRGHFHVPSAFWHGSSFQSLRQLVRLLLDLRLSSRATRNLIFEFDILF